MLTEETIILYFNLWIQEMREIKKVLTVLMKKKNLKKKNQLKKVREKGENQKKLKK